MTNTIIVDVEWDPGSKIPSPTLLQIGAVKLNENMQIVDSYFSFIKPYHEIIDMNHLNFMPATESEILNGKDRDIVLSEFSQWCGDIPSFIIWGSVNYQVFKIFVKDYLEINLDNTIDLQFTYSIHLGTGILSVEKICKEIGFEIPYILHHSLNDAKLVAELYFHIQTKFDLAAISSQYYLERAERKRDKLREKRRLKRLRTRKQLRALHKSKKKIHPYKFFVFEESCEIHRKGCIALSEINNEDIKGFETLENAIKNSQKTCPLCFQGNINLHPALTPKQAIQLIELHSLCYDRGLVSENYESTFIINTPVGSWYFVFGTNEPILYHRNYLFEASSTKGVLNGYHKQPRSFNSDREVILYINKHDKKVLSGEKEILGDISSS